MGSVRSVLVVMDVQGGVVDMVPGAGAVVDRLSSATAAARAAGVPVVLVRLALRPGRLDVHPRNATFAGVAASGLFDDGSPGAELDPALGAGPGDVVVTKRRVSAFAGSDLDAALRGLGAEEVVLAGLFTSGVVLSTARDAADLDLAVVVLADGCADPDPGLHRVVLDQLLPPHAVVTTVEGWVAGLGAPAAAPAPSPDPEEAP